MIELADGRSTLFQWDTGVKLDVSIDCKELHFSNNVYGKSTNVEVIDGMALVPDFILQTAKPFTVWAFYYTPKGAYTKMEKVFHVSPRNKPADYVFAEPEKTKLSEILERLEALEENGVKIEEKDPTVPEWAKSPEKPQYTASEIGALEVGELKNAVDLALLEAKESGLFDGAPGEQGEKGEKGDPGEPGAPGANGENGQDGKDGADGYTPQKGVDYWTTEDKSDIVSEVLNALPTWTGGSY